MAIIGRLSKLEERAKPLQDEIERKEKELKRKEEFFKFLNEVMEECHPEHGWCKYSVKERLRIYNKSTPRGTIKTDCVIPMHIPSKKKEDILYMEALRLVGDVFWEELSNRREEKYLKK